MNRVGANQAHYLSAGSTPGSVAQDISANCHGELSNRASPLEIVSDVVVQVHFIAYEPVITPAVSFQCEVDRHIQVLGYRHL